jgi:hypothetical protein
MRFFFFFFFFFLLFPSAPALEVVGSVPLDLSFISIKQHIHNWCNASALTATRCELPNLSRQRRGSLNTLGLARAFAGMPTIPTIITTTHIDHNNTISRIISKSGKAKA